MAGWFPFALAALLLMGTQRFLYKVAMERGCDTARTTLFFMATVTGFSVCAWIFLGSAVTDLRFLLLVGLVNSIAFLAATTSHMEALRRLPAAVAYPLVRLDAVLVVLISLVLFHERLTGRQGIGICLAVAAALLLARERGECAVSRNRAAGYLFVAAAILGGAAAAVSSRFAALGTDKTAFMSVSYGLSTLFMLRRDIGRSAGVSPAGSRDYRTIGFAMGAINVAGYYAYLEGLSRGPLSLVTVITGMHFVVAVILSLLVYRERLTLLRGFGILLAVASLVLLKG